MEMTCHRCGESVAPSTPLYSDHVRAPDGTLSCADCARTERAHGQPVTDGYDEPVMVVNATHVPLPNSH